MSKKYFKSPVDLVKEWPEIFDDMYMNTLPVDYLKSLRLCFENGMIWEFDIQERLVDYSNDFIVERLLEIFNEYKNEITKIDFAIDIDKLKKDISNSSKNIL